jgi:D-glycero-alpha-D-manno-heptose-7-phosphate kinase
MVVNAAIAIYMRVDFLLGDHRIRLRAEDLGKRVTLATSGLIRYDGTLDLHKAALNMLPVTGGIEVLSRSDAPSGSGLGASGALDVALLAGLARCREEHFTPNELAELGYELEAGELGLLGGKQDQYAAALGGFNELTFPVEGEAQARRLSVSGEAAEDLATHLVLAYTGHSHFSSQTHARVWDAFESGDARVTGALRAMHDLVSPAADAIAAESWEELAAIVAENWRHQQQLDSTISTPRTRVIESAAFEAGAWGLKATGAGAGGCVVILCPSTERERVREAVSGAGGQVLECSFSNHGVAVWEEEPGATRP